MNQPQRRWLAISFFNLLLVAALGVLMRYKIEFHLPLVQQKYALHSHSHFAFSGWITQTLMVLMVHWLSTQLGEQVYKKYRWLLVANLVTAYGMLVAFLLQGYGFFSISFSTLSIFVAYVFAATYWRQLNTIREKKLSHAWLKASLVFSVISSIGAFSLAYMMASKVNHQNLYLAAIYFFLHFQYNGWFFFAGMGLLVAQLEKMGLDVKKLRRVFLLFVYACIPAYFLSVLWLRLPLAIYSVTVVAVLMQLAGWWWLVKWWVRHRPVIYANLPRRGRVLLLLAALAFSIKLILQTGSVHPALSQLSYGFRPIIIGYLHLVLLAVTSVFMLGYIVSFKLIVPNKTFRSGTFIFVVGIMVNEVLLMIQGVAAFSYLPIPYINIYLLVAAIILLSGAGLMFLGVKSVKQPGEG